MQNSAMHDHGRRWKVVGTSLPLAPKDDALENARRVAIEIASYQASSRAVALPNDLLSQITPDRPASELPSQWLTARRQFHPERYLRAAPTWLGGLVLYLTVVILFGLLVTVPGPGDVATIVMTTENESLIRSREMLAFELSAGLPEGHADGPDVETSGVEMDHGDRLERDQLNELDQLAGLSSLGDTSLGNTSLGDADFGQREFVDHWDDLLSDEPVSVDLESLALEPFNSVPPAAKNQVADSAPADPILRLKGDRRPLDAARRALRLDETVDQGARRGLDTEDDAQAVIRRELAARKRLMVAQSLDSNGAKTTARRMYQQVIDQFPNTRSAQLAANRLIEMGPL